MNTNNRKTDLGGCLVHTTNQVNGEGAQVSASAGMEISMSDTAADLHTIQIFFGMSASRLQALWDQKWTPILGHWIEWTSALTVAVQGAEYHEQNTS